MGVLNLDVFGAGDPRKNMSDGQAKGKESEAGDETLLRYEMK